jgi:hypothetical protein
MGFVETGSGVQLMAVYLDSTSTNMGINLGDPTELRTISNLTVSAWIKPESWGQSSYGRIADKKAGGSGWAFFLNNQSVGSSITFTRDRFVDASVTGAYGSISLNVWQHVAVTYQSSAIKIYVNGNEVSYYSYSLGSGSLVSDMSRNLIVGNRGNGARGFKGSIDDFRIYDRVLSAGEIEHIYTACGRDSIWYGRLTHLPLNQWAPGASLGSDQVKDVTANGLSGTSVYSGTIGAEGII